MVNCRHRDAIQVPAADGKMRFWRNTTVATLARRRRRPRCRTGTLGYEWDEDVDNGVRPAGLIDLSTTDADGASRCCRTTARRTAPARPPTT